MSNEDEALIAKLQEISDGEIVIFTKQEADNLKEVALWWARFKGASAIGGAIGTFAKWFLVFAAFIAAMRAGLFDWIMSAGGGQ